MTDADERLRFEFGRNWQSFLASLDDGRIAAAEHSLKSMLGLESLAGRSFLDVGCGSGLFSLAARRLGARVLSFDADPRSLACARELKRRFDPDSPDWEIRPGSALDPSFLSGLGTFDIVYAWGVLHHTGAMWQALDQTTQLVSAAQGSFLFVALYNDQGWRSSAWRAVKRVYNQLPGPFRFVVLGPAFARIWGPTFLKDLLRGRPLRTWSEYRGPRGMSPWHDVVDWVGGYPFETARPDDVVEFCARRGFRLQRLAAAGAGYGCNEFIFERAPQS